MLPSLSRCPPRCSSPLGRHIILEHVPPRICPNPWSLLTHALVLVRTGISDQVKDKPVFVEMLGERLVLWRDERGNAQCMSDVCLHRGAPMHKGKVVDFKGQKCLVRIAFSPPCCPAFRHLHKLLLGEPVLVAAKLAKFALCKSSLFQECCIHA